MRRSWSTRMVVLSAVVCFLIILLAYPVRIWLSQQAEIKRESALLEVDQANLQFLKQELAKWEDDYFVEQQIIRRLNFPPPYYLPVQPNDSTTGPLAPIDNKVELLDPSEVAPADPNAEQVWFAQLWSTVEQAAINK